jgi:hypothetical protein
MSDKVTISGGDVTAMAVLGMVRAGLAAVEGTIDGMILSLATGQADKGEMASEMTFAIASVNQAFAQLVNAATHAELNPDTGVDPDE